ADVWNTAPLGKSVFFRTNDRIFQLTDGQVSVYHTPSMWQFLGHAENRLFAQDGEHGLLEFRQNEWVPLPVEQPLTESIVVDVFALGGDSIVFATASNETYLLQSSRLQRFDTAPWQDLYTPSFSKISEHEYATATSLAGCLIRNRDGRVIQRIGVAEGLANNN